MIERYFAPLPPALADTLAALQARAYAPTGMRAWSPSEISALLETQTTRLLVAQNNIHQPIGFLLASVVLGEAEILSIVVDPSQQRRGTASKLIMSLEEGDVGAGIESVMLEVAENNRNAIFLYETLRFRKVGIRRNYYLINGVRVDARLMEKRCTLD